MELTRRPDETKYDYHKRLVYGKLVDKTLADADYSELAELIYGRPYSSDVARRMLYGSRFTLEAIDEDAIRNTSAEDMSSELDFKMIELQKERKKLSDQRRELTKLVTESARSEHIYDVIRQVSEDMQPLGSMLDDTWYYSVKSLSENEAVIAFTDWHYGMKTDNVFNTYNADICKERVSNVVASAAERIILNRCSKLHVVVLGDLAHGAIHMSARVASEELVCDQIMHVSELLAQAIHVLSKLVEETRVYITYGNHMRTVQQKSESMHRDNMERLLGWWLEQRFKDDDSVIIMPEPKDEFLFINACGHEFCASHGDLDAVKSSPRLLATLFQKKYGKDIEYILIGDKHHRESFEELGVTAMLCGSLCGSDDYAAERRLFSEPQQLLLIVNPENGVDAEYRIKCE